MTSTRKMWRKRFLIPLWVVELIAMGIFFILGCVLLAWSTNDDAQETLGYSRSEFSASGAIVVSITGLSILLTFIETGLFAAGKLKPVFHLVSAVIKAAIWLIYFIIIIIGSAASGSASAIDIILSLAAMVCTVAQLIYGSIVVHRMRKGVFNNNNNNNNHSYGPVTYEAENGYKMASSPMPENPQYR